MSNGWEFATENYIFLPNDYDGCFANGIRLIRKILLHWKYPEVYIKNHGDAFKVLEELKNEK